MSFVDVLEQFYFGPAFGMLIWVLCSYIAVYVVALAATRIWVSLRSGTRPTIDQIAHRVLIVCFLACLGLPIFFAYRLAVQFPWHTIPFALAVLVDVMILTRLFGKLRKPPVRSRTHA
jgi:hypothetical protein